MKVEDRKGEANIALIVSNIEGDMGETTRLNLLQQADGDVVLTLQDTETGQSLSIEFCSRLGGGRNPFTTQKLREFVRILVETA